MFNLNQSIAEWRREMLAANVTNPSVLDELESHLRDEIEEQMRLGAGPEEAFKISVARIGRPAELRDEFARAGRRKPLWLRRLKAIVLGFLGLPVRCPIPLTAGAREILEEGAKEARGFHHDFIGTEHLLLGLLESKNGAVPALLQKLGLDAKTVRSQINEIVGNGTEHETDRLLPYTPRVKRALEFAGAEASEMNQSQISTEHIFLGLLREGGGVAALVLKRQGIDIQSARNEIKMRFQ